MLKLKHNLLRAQFTNGIEKRHERKPRVETCYLLVS